MDQLDTVVKATARNNIWIGAVRAGKTVATVAAWLDYLLKCAPGTIHGIVGKTSSTVQRNIIVENLRPRLGKLLVERRGYVEIEGRRCEIFGANDERSTDKLLGATLHSALCDEMTTWSEKYFRVLQTRLSPPGARLFGTANPAGPFHWLKAVVDRPDVNHFHMTLEDNPHLSDEYVRAVKAEMKAAGPAFYGRYILGNWVAAEGNIYNFDDNLVNGLDGVVFTGQRAIGVDIGYAVPTAAVELKQADDGRVFVTRELYYDPKNRPRMSDDDQVDMLLGWMAAEGDPVCEIYVDPAAAGFRQQMFKRGVVPYGGSRRTHDIRQVMKGIAKVQSLFGEGSLLVNRNCVNLVKELSGYSWDEKATEKGLDRPLKEADHACDALRYGVVGGWKLWTL